MQGRPKKKNWIFGIADTSFKPSVAPMEIVSHRDTEILLNNVQSVVEKGPIVHSDEGQAYGCCSPAVKRCTHGTFNHSIKFVERDVESNWITKKL